MAERTPGRLTGRDEVMPRKARTTKATEVEPTVDEVEAAPVDEVEAPAAVEDGTCNVVDCQLPGTHHGLCCGHWATRRGERTR